MFPFIPTPIGKLPSFTLLAVVGVLSMLWFVYCSINKEHRSEESSFIFPRIVICGMCGFVFAGFVDFVFKYIEYGVIKFYGITFYGGLIGAIISMYVILSITKETTRYSKKEWYNILIPPFIVFHIFGRIGCFLGGCCYGRNSDSIFAVAFPDNAETGIYHYGEKCLPTQLFEVVALIIILFIVWRCKNRLRAYLYLYAPTRFVIEFLRGDDRGEAFLLSPSQMISLGIITVLIVYEIITLIKKHKLN